jgi:Ca2+:H+ antiporter
VVPAIFHSIVRNRPEAHEQELSFEIACVLFATYLLHLTFSLRTHKHLYAGVPAAHGASGTAGAGHAVNGVWSRRLSVLVLLGATAAVALLSEFLVGAIEHTARVFGMTEVFVGVILVAVIGNAAEHSTAVLVATKNQMDLAVNIAVGSSIQVALFVAPILVFASYLFGRPMDLRFTTFEVVAVAISVASLSLIALDGESNWLEGVHLLAVYLILAMAFYFLPG